LTTRIIHPENVPFAPNIDTKSVHFQWRSFFRRVAERVSNLPSYTVAGVPDAAQSGAGALIYVTDETGGAVPAFSDGSDWRRVTDRTVVS
jgi:hypothetical protein